MERTNARYLTEEHIPVPLDFVSVDVSFISLNLILPALRPLIKEGGLAVCLVKPQFEAGKDKVGKKGVVRDPAVHLEVLEHFLAHARAAGFALRGLTFSPIRGPEGNIEYLLWLEKRPEISAEILELSEKEAETALAELLVNGGGISRQEEQAARIRELVEEAHQALDEAKSV